MKYQVEISYVTTLPLFGNAPRVTVYSNDSENKVFISLYNLDDGSIIRTSTRVNTPVTFSGQQFYTNWRIDVTDIKDKLIHTETFNPRGKKIFIKMDANALGDNIAWIPYVEEFRKKHDCLVICSTFYNEIFIKSYPEILFVKPNTVVENLYAQYYIGASNDNNLVYTPVEVNKVPLQEVASRSLGLPNIELRPDLSGEIRFHEPMIANKYVCISEYGSSDIKHWKAENGWQSVVNYLNALGYGVVVISKEPTTLKNILDWTGPHSLIERMVQLRDAEFFIGVSSGLAWLSWSVGTRCVMISDVTPNWHEFQSNIIRVNANDLDMVDYEIKNVSSVTDVLQKLRHLAD